MRGWVWVGATKGRLFRLDFLSAKFWQDFFRVSGSQSQKKPAPLSNKPSIFHWALSTAHNWPKLAHHLHCAQGQEATLDMSTPQAQLASPMIQLLTTSIFQSAMAENQADPWGRGGLLPAMQDPPRPSLPPTAADILLQPQDKGLKPLPGLPSMEAQLARSSTMGQKAAYQRAQVQPEHLPPELRTASMRLDPSVCPRCQPMPRAVGRVKAVLQWPSTVGALCLAVSAAPSILCLCTCDHVRVQPPPPPNRRPDLLGF